MSRSSRRARAHTRRKRLMVALGAGWTLLFATPTPGCAQLGTLLKRRAEEMATRVAADAATGAASRSVVATPRIYFDLGSGRLRPESGPALREAAALLAAHPDLRLVIEGHTDDSGSNTANQGLSEQRAKAVRDALAGSFGADASRLAARGFGSSRPAAANDTPEGRQANRRVELVINQE